LLLLAVSFLQSFVFFLVLLQSAAGFVTPRSLGLSRSSTTCAASAADVVKQTIASADVVVFSKSSCPFCKKTKALFDEVCPLLKGLKFYFLMGASLILRFSRPSDFALLADPLLVWALASV
jgi:thiol-disulfide isomerase/thioredoxin